MARNYSVLQRARGEGRAALLGWLCSTIAWLVIVLLPGTAGAETPRPVVYLVPVEGVIDLGLAPFISRVLHEAESSRAAAVVLEVNTFGGRVDAAVLIRDALLQSNVRTVAFVNKRAISAGALISLAARTIMMAEGSTIGAATPVQMGAPGSPAQPVEEKTVSYMRKEFSATAESRGRPTLLAEAMVDADVDVPGVVAKGKLLTMTTEEALRHKIADRRAKSVDEVLAALRLSDAERRVVSETWAESLVRFLTHPIVSSVLMAVGVLGLIVEIQSPGFGLPGALGAMSLALFLGGHWLVRLAGWEELLLVAVGLALLAVEVFVLPGFGIAGALGLVSVLSGLGLSLIGSGASWPAVMTALGQTAASVLVAIVVALILLRFLPRLPLGRRLILDTGLSVDEGYGSAPETDLRWLGKRGTTVTALRPAGIAHFDHERVDVVSDGEWVEQGQLIEVSRVDGNRIVVRRVGPEQEVERRIS